MSDGCKLQYSVPYSKKPRDSRPVTLIRKTPPTNLYFLLLRRSFFRRLRSLCLFIFLFRFLRVLLMCRTEVVFSSIWLPPPIGEIVCIHGNDDNFIASVALFKLLFPIVIAVEKWEYRPMMLVADRCTKAREATENMILGWESPLFVPQMIRKSTKQQ